LDFAGGTVVHISSGFSSLIATLVVGPRPLEKHKPSNIPFVLLGGGLIWYGWFAFNAASALSSGQLASVAFANTHIAAAISMCTWMVLDVITNKMATAVGATCGAIVGLVAITPCAGFVHPQSSMAIGVLSTCIVYGVIILKGKHMAKAFPHLDDSLDVFTCHGIGGLSGAILLGFFASKSVNPAGEDGVFFGNPILLAYQLLAVVVAIIWSSLITLCILLPLKYGIGLTPPIEQISVGMDIMYHGATAHPDMDDHTTSDTTERTELENTSAQEEIKNKRAMMMQEMNEGIV